MQRVLNARYVETVTKDMVYIGRYPDKSGNRDKHFGNPFSHLSYSRASVWMPTREKSIEAFEKWIRGEAYQYVEPKRREWILENLEKLRGKDLLCFCHPHACHGDVYKKLLEKG